MEKGNKDTKTETHLSQSAVEGLVIKPCPFCGMEPEVQPEEPERDGNAWGKVLCINPDCPAQPVVMDGIFVSDDRGSDKYKENAIFRWNTRVL